LDGLPLIARSEVIGYLTLDSPWAASSARLKQPWLKLLPTSRPGHSKCRLFEAVQAGHAQLQLLSRRLVEVQETERRHIARELHDEASQALTSLMVGLRLLERELAQPEAATTRLMELKRMTDSVLENLHRLAMDLRPASLDHLGLVAALRHYIDTFNRQYQPALTAEFCRGWL